MWELLHEIVPHSYLHVIVQLCKNVWNWQHYAASTKTARFSAFRALSFPVLLFCVWIWKEPVSCTTQDGQSYCRCSKWSSIGSHAASQVLGEVRHGLVDVFLLQLFPDSLRNHISKVREDEMRICWDRDTQISVLLRFRCMGEILSRYDVVKALLLRTLGSKLLGGTKPTLKKVGWDVSHLTPWWLRHCLQGDFQLVVLLRLEYMTVFYSTAPQTW